jgi:acyl carrier protein
MSESIFEKIATILSTKKGIDKESILIESSFEELGLDSLDAVELISDLEDEFNVTIPNVELQSIKTIQQAVDGLQKAMGS